MGPFRNYPHNTGREALDRFARHLDSLNIFIEVFVLTSAVGISSSSCLSVLHAFTDCPEIWNQPTVYKDRAKNE